MKKLRQLMLTAVIIGSVLTTATAAESFSVLLQKGIFAEETEGNLDLTIQNAADLEYPATNPANAATHDEFRLNTFPPDNHAPPTPPQPTPPAK